MKNLILFIILQFSIVVFAQKITKISLQKFQVAELSDSLRETSGLAFFNQHLLTFNDGGNPNEIYEINPKTGKILKKFKTNVPNIDWEAITTDSNHIYIGDFGNNLGNREDLVVHQFNFSDDQNFEKSESLQESLKLPFSYQNQSDFSPKNLQHNFDTEAMIFLNGKLHIFTKEWASKATSHYILDPQKSEKQNLVSAERYQTNFVVTDAAYFNKQLFLVGYTKKAKVFLMIFDEDELGNFFSKPTKKYKLGSAFHIGQVEGIAVNQDGIYISNEQFLKFGFHPKQRLYFIPNTEFQH